MIGYDTRSGQVFVLDGQGPAPAAATPAVFAELGLDLVPGTGLLAACVPAAFGTWMLLLERYGTLPLREVLEYAIGYASDGYPMLDTASAAIAAVSGTFTEHWPTSAEIYLRDGVPAGGSRFANPVLADVYRRILAEAEAAGPVRERQIEAARRAFYEGFVAEAIAGYLDKAEVRDVSGEPHRGLLAGPDLAGWRASAEEPVTLDFAGLTVCKTGPWGQGPVFLQQLALLDGFDLELMGPGSANFIHTVTECAKLAFADREAWYGDPRQSDVPVSDLLSAGYAAQRRGLVTEFASGDLIPGSPGGRAAAAGLRAGRVREHRRAGRGRRGAGRCRRPAGPPAAARARAERHLPPGRGRQVRQHRRRHAQRRLAAELAGDPRPGLLPGQPGADVHPHAGVRQHAGAGPAAAYHAVAQPGAARRGAVPGLRHARW